MADIKYAPVKHDHQAFLAKARSRKGFTEAYDALELEYRVADQLLKARSRAGLTQDAVAERMGTIILSALVAHTAWHWMAERWGVLSQYDLQWPAFDAAVWAAALRWMMIAVIVGGCFWFLWVALRQRNAARQQ